MATDDVTTLAGRRDRALGASAPLFYREPIHLVRGDGASLFDADGRRYVDMYNNVPCVGHANPRVAEAMARQQATLNVHSRYLHESIVELAERLCGLHPARPIESVVFSCSGTEAVDVALQMARITTGRQGFVATDATYHGNSGLVASLGLAAGAPAAHPMVRSIPFPQRFRPAEAGATEAELTARHLAHLADAIDALERSGPGFAGLVLCSIQANEGLPDLPAGFMHQASTMAAAAGGLVIADEVQAGYARTGQWWGYEVSGLVPDIVVTGKPMGNGLPLAATAGRHDVVSAFRVATRHFNTFAASPLQAAVGLAVLDEIEERDLLAHVTRVGATLAESLRARLDPERRPWMADVRGVGLFLGIEIVADPSFRTPDVERAVDIVNRLKDEGFLTSNAGAHHNVVKIRPPLVFGEDDAAAFLEAFDRVLADLDD